MASYSRMLTNALLNPSFGGQTMFDLGRSATNLLPGGVVDHTNQRMLRQRDGMQSMLAQAGQATPGNATDMYQSIVATAQQTGADPTNALSVLKQKTEAESAAKQQKADMVLSSIINNPSFDFSDAKAKQVFFQVAGQLGVPTEKAGEMFQSFRTMSAKENPWKVVGNNMFNVETEQWKEAPTKEEENALSNKEMLSLPEKYTIDSIEEAWDPKTRTVDITKLRVIPEEAKGGEGGVTTTPKETVGKLAALDQVFGVIDQAREAAGDSWAVSFDLAKYIPLTEAKNLNGLVTTLNSELAFSRLQKMRDESKTGGALGQVSNIELELLRSSVANLDPSAGDKVFMRRLDEVQQHYENFKNALLGQAPTSNNYKKIGSNYYYKNQNGNWLDLGNEASN
jgi:hypothetical protein